MIRYEYPFNGKRFLLNLNTGEIHDLLKETALCHIDDIKPEHISMADSFEEAQIYAIMVAQNCNPNGCHYCCPSRDNG